MSVLEDIAKGLALGYVRTQIDYVFNRVLKVVLREVAKADPELAAAIKPILKKKKAAEINRVMARIERKL